ncbi:MAG TPA: SDR family NAD(P)-dependent oxidoreductase, partial [Terriglobales bacterium]|nr:SDR family NAD(P)-dependent oxidoreductase [Terriglobales bacterium]
MMSDNRRSGFSFPMKLLLFSAAAAGLTYVVRQQRRMDFMGKTVLIAGASRGLGLELARAFAREGANLALLARDEARLREAARELGELGVRVWVHACDISKEDQVRESVSAILKETERIEILVNNAGIIQVGPVEVMASDDYEKSMGVHFWGPLYLMREV